MPPLCSQSFECIQQLKELLHLYCKHPTNEPSLAKAMARRPIPRPAPVNKTSAELNVMEFRYKARQG